MIVQKNDSLVGNKPFHQKSVTSLKYSIDGNLVASAGADRKVHVFNLQGEILHTIESLAGINDCCWFSDSHLLFASDDGSIKLHDLNKSKTILSYRAAKAFPYCMDVNRQNHMIVVGDTDGFVSSFHVTNKELIHRFIAHAATVTSMQHNDTYNELLTSSHDGTVRSWIPSMKTLCLRTIVPVPKICTPVSNCSYSSNQQYILCSTLDHYHRLYKKHYHLPDSGEAVHLKQYTGHVNKRFTMTSKTITIGDRHCIISGSEDGKIVLWDATTESKLEACDAHNGPVLTLATFSNSEASGFDLISGGADGKIQFWSLNTQPPPSLMDDVRLEG